MSTASARSAAARSGARRESARAARRRAARRRRILLLAAVAVIAAILTAVLSPWADKAVQELALPLHHEDIIRQQAAEKNLDPSLIAGVIYVESHFRDQT